MTGREYLNRRKRWVFGGVAVGIVLLVGGLAGLPLLVGAGLDGPAVTAVVVPGVAVFVATVIAGQKFLFRCPWCRGNLGVLLTQKGVWRTDPKVRFCPYCGTDLDDPVGGGGDWDAPVE
ncbi:MAG: hypothetical protein U0804_03465 [Gemmataceae bacterium]